MITTYSSGCFLQRYLIPQVQLATGVTDEDLVISTDSIGSLIKWYCRESGVRNLQKQIEKVSAFSSLNSLSLFNRLPSEDIS